jgi:hypothetical protein
LVSKAKIPGFSANQRFIPVRWDYSLKKAAFPGNVSL